MDDPLPLRLISIIVLLILSSIFSGTETAFTSLSIIQKKELEKTKSKTAQKAYKLLCQPDLLLTTILIGNNIVNIFASSLTTTLVYELFGNQYVAFATGILTILILLFGEITPKQIALVHNKKIACAMSYPIWFLTIILFPIVWLFRNISFLLTSLFSKGKKQSVTLESIMHIVDVAEDEGIVDENESSLVQKVLRFNETNVKTIMTHRTEVFSIPSNLTISEAFPQIEESGYSRIPIYGEEDKENIVGVVLVRTILKEFVKGNNNILISDIAETPFYVPETMHLDDILIKFKKEKLQLAVVLDEYGGLSGIVSMEDVVEQLFGEIYDEHEEDEGERIEENVESLGSYIVQCDTTFQEFVDEFEIIYPHADHISTVAAYLLEQNGDIPMEGDLVTTEVGLFKIKEMKGNRMETVLFIPSEKLD